MTKAMQRIETLCDSNEASRIRRCLDVASTWKNCTAFLHSLAVSPNKNALFDDIATLRYGLIFKGLGFLPSFEPTGSQGPDLLIARDAVSATVEVTRFKAMNSGPPQITGKALHNEEFMLASYGCPQRDIPKSKRKIIDKFPQATATLALIAVWNDDDALEEVEMDIALRELQRDPRVPVGLQFVIYGSSWGQRLYCYPMRLQLEDLVQQWAQEITSVNVDAAVDAGLK